MNMFKHIRQSNLIENIDDEAADAQSLRAWNYVRKAPHITETVMLRLHKLITKDQLPANESGNFRNVQVMVGGRICPDPYLAQQMIFNWIIDLLEHKDTLSPKDMHIRFEQIHPFIDGNGRTGRMLMWWHEKKLGLEPTLIKFDERQEYYEWFK